MKNLAGDIQCDSEIVRELLCAGINIAPPSGESSYAVIRDVQITNIPVGIHFTSANNWLVTGCKITLFKNGEWKVEEKKLLVIFIGDFSKTQLYS